MDILEQIAKDWTKDLAFQAELFLSIETKR